MEYPVSKERILEKMSRLRMYDIIIRIFFILLLASSALVIAPESLFAQTLAAVDVNFDPHEQVGHNQMSEEENFGENMVGLIFFYTIRFIYYGALMFAAGVMLWSLAIPAGANETQRKLTNRWSLYAMRILLLAVLVFVFVHMRTLMKGFDGGDLNEWLRLLGETAVGRSWLAIILLSLLGFVAIKLNDTVKMVWALLLLAAECYNGHVLALPSNTTAIVLDFIHLVCSALWVGGLILLLLFGIADRTEAGKFAAKFTRTAWLTILLLIVSGIIMTGLMLPSWLYLIYTTWGLLLLAKIACVAAVAGVGFFLHRRAKRGEHPQGSLLRIDAALMAVILIIVSVFTYVSPKLNTDPLHYHKMGEQLHYTLAITPNGPGPNEVTLKVWLPEPLGAPTDVELLLRSNNRPQSAVLAIPLKRATATVDESFPGFVATDYIAERVHLPLRGEWSAELTITDQVHAVTKQVIVFRND